MSTGPDQGGGLVVGVGWAAGAREGGHPVSSFVGCSDDSVVLPGVKDCEALAIWQEEEPADHGRSTDLGRFCKESFENWGEEAEGEGLTRCWTGVKQSSSSCPFRTLIVLLRARHHGLLARRPPSRRTCSWNAGSVGCSRVPRFVAPISPTVSSALT